GQWVISSFWLSAARSGSRSMGFDLRRMIANAVVRRVVYVLVALVLASVGIGRAEAATFPTREEAWTACRAFIDTPIEGKPYINIDCRWSGPPSKQYSASKCNKAGGTQCSNSSFVWVEECPAGTPGWNDETHTCGCPSGQIWIAGAMTCKMDCSAEPGSIPDGWTILPAAGTSGTVCVGGCDYRRPSSGIEIRKVVDGIT